MESESQMHFQKKIVISRLSVALHLGGVFGYFHHLQSLTSAQLVQRLANLIKSHLEDLKASLCDEFVHFSELLKTELAADVDAKQDLVKLRMYRAITKNFLNFSFPNVEHAVHIHLSFIATYGSWKVHFVNFK